MSDEEYYDYGSDEDFSCGSGDEDGGAEEDNTELEIENYFFDADDMRKSKPNEALEKLEKVLELEAGLEQEKRKKSFRAIVMKINILFQQKLHDSIIDSYKTFLSLKNLVHLGEFTTAVSSVINLATQTEDESLIYNVFQTSLEAFSGDSNTNLFFSTKIKLGRRYVAEYKLAEAETVLQELYVFCESYKHLQNYPRMLVDSFSIEVDICRVTGDKERFSVVYDKMNTLCSSVSDSSLMGGVREEGGKLHLSEHRYEEAYSDFYDAFKAYSDSGDGGARECLVLLILCSILCGRSFDVRGTPESSVFSEDEKIKAMTRIQKSVETGDIRLFESTCGDIRNGISDDSTVLEHIAPLRDDMRVKAVIDYAKIYTYLPLTAISRDIMVPLKEIDQFVEKLAFSPEVNGRLDVVHNRFVFYE